MAKSGLDSLLDALRASGANVDDKFKRGNNVGNSNTSSSASNSQNAQNTSSNSSKSGNSSSKKRGAATNLGDIPKAILDLPIVSSVKNWSKKGKIIGIIFLLIILGCAYWWFHPPINIHSETTWLIFAVLILLPIFLLLISKQNKYAAKGFKKNDFANKTAKAKSASSKSCNGAKTTDSQEKIINSDAIKQENSNKSKLYKKLALIPVVVACLGLLGALISATFFPGNAEKYASVLQTENLDFKTDIQEVNYSQIPIIDRDTARVLGTKEMGTIPDYVSQFEISNLYSQINFQGSPVRVSCLMYADLFKWLTNREEGIPAYCIIDMATQDAKIVRISDVDGTSGQGIKYSESEPFARNIERYIQLKYPFYMFDEFSFEVDEDGHPWWICPVQERTIGLFGGTTIKRVVMCDAVTGECSDIDISDVPQWTDRVYPSELLIEQYNWSGKYKNGWLNSWIGQNGVVKTTPGTTSTSNSSSSSSGSSKNTLGYNYIAKDDDVWVYTGVTSATSDSSIVGFILINQRTQESHFYSISGATEVSAMESAEGQVQNLRYSATFPILINVSNQPTYFISLKDSAGLVKKYAMIDIQRYQNVAIGDTVAESQKSYKNLLAREGIANDYINNSAKETTGTIATLAQAVIDGNTHFYATLSGDSKIYDFILPAMLNIVKYKVGDPITISYSESDTTCTVMSIK